ncbi:hypothetical protein J6352_25660, partial [Burkholderia pseudomallei]|uniref:hypothetical protein n=1 Tax=Burkholderia pseudomallei TaxID=28450 RepID=UPI001AD7205D
RQAMPLGTGGAFELSTSLMRIGAARITDCINYGKVVDVISAGVTRKKVECKDASKAFSVKYVDEQITKVTICVAEFYYAVRPSPFDDLHPEKIVDNVGRAVSGISSACNGVTMLGLSYEQAYGKYKTPSRGGELAN